MDVLKLLTEARSAGLTVEAQGDRLIVKGPKQATVIVKELGEHKAEVMAALAAISAPPSEAHPAILDAAENRRQTQQHHAQDAGQAGPQAVQGPKEPASVPAAKASTTDQYKRYTEANPAKVTVQGKTYDVAVTCGVWFFRLDGYPEVGWSGCSDGFVTLIEGQLEPARNVHEKRAQAGYELHARGQRDAAGAAEPAAAASRGR